MIEKTTKKPEKTTITFRIDPNLKENMAKTVQNSRIYRNLTHFVEVALEREIARTDH